MPRALAFALSLLLASPLWAATGTLRVSGDWGGEVDARITQIAQLKRDGTRVVITGVCASACTLYLALPTTCVAKGARLGFHGPQAKEGFMPLATFNTYQQLMADHYPPRMAAWFKAGPGSGMDGEDWLNARQAVAMGAKAC
jgi:hypothetical protein